MSLSRDSRTERKLKFLLRKQFQIKQGLERIDFEEDVLIPEIEKLKAGQSVLGLEAGVAFDFEIADAYHFETKKSAPTGHHSVPTGRDQDPDPSASGA